MHLSSDRSSERKCYSNEHLLEEAEQNIVICQRRADQLFAEAEG